MKNSVATPNQVISLPKGGGALGGLGEKFAPDLFTGTGNFSVPIALPPGRNGFQPELNLVYSTGNGNGAFGLGWGLSVPGVTRKTSKGVPVYDDALDTFILSGAEDLVPVSLTDARTVRYRPRSEGLFALIDHHHDASDNFWRVRTKDGRSSDYGTPRPPAANPAWRDPAVVVNPVDESRIFAWNLTVTEDPFGNRIEFDYLRDSGFDAPHHVDQIYLRQCRYVDYSDGNQTRFLVTVTFHYEDRPDPFSSYRSGFEIRTRWRATRIDIHTHTDQTRLARTYELVYLDQRRDSEHQLPINGVSLLSQVRVVGHDGPRTEEMAPLEFEYTAFQPARRTFAPLTGELPVRSLADPHVEMVDLFGNGLPDILEMNGQVRYWRNAGGGRFDPPRPMAQAPAGLNIAQPGVRIFDANGDGRADLVVTTATLNGFFPLRFGASWDRRSFQPYRQAPTFSLEDPEVQLVDLDGDGVTDAIRSSSRLECYFSDARKGWHRTHWVEREVAPNVNFSDPRVRLADMAGDGLQDIVVVADGNVEYWPNLGRGNWGERKSMRNCPRFPYGYNPRQILLGDVDGDGVADLVFVDHFRVLVWINQSGNRWSDPIEIEGTPPISDMDAVRLTDLNGTGVAGVLWSRDADGSSREQAHFLDFTGGTKPYLMAGMDNHMGSVTRVEYAPSTRYYLEDQQSHATRWNTTLPFPVQVVAKVEAIDQISGGKLTTTYRYHHGYWDGGEREFRGFGRVDQRDTEAFQAYHDAGSESSNGFAAVAPRVFSPPVETRTWFHLGPVGEEFGDWEEADFSSEYWPGDPNVLSRPGEVVQLLDRLTHRARRDAVRALRGHELRRELYALDGDVRQDRPYSVVECLYGLREESTPPLNSADQPRIFFAFAVAQRSTQWERGTEPQTRFTLTGDYDAYGQPRSQALIAVPRGRDFQVPAVGGEPYLATQTETTFAQRDDAQRYMIDRVARTTNYEIGNDGSPSMWGLIQAITTGAARRQIIGQKLNFYDGPEFQGLPFGQLGDYGALVRSEVLVFTREILQDGYRSDANVRGPPEESPYLVPDVPAPVWSADYPQEFRALAPLAGYNFRLGGAGSEYAAGYFAAVERRQFDFHRPGATRRGLVRATRDPLGHDTTIDYDNFDLLPTRAIDPAGLSAGAVYDYRVLHPAEVTGANGNRTACAFTPLGNLERVAVMGRAGHDVGDTIAAPGTRFEYDFLAFRHRRQPISVRTVRRVHHQSDIHVPLPARNETLESIDYSDGFGRLLQSRALAEDVRFGEANFGDSNLPVDPAQAVGAAEGRVRAGGAPVGVVVTGWQTYDNKGRVVEKYEPFFDTGWDHAPPTATQNGQRATLFYDPLGRAVRTVAPDGSEQRTIYGQPVDLDNPDVITPTPWVITTYDPNDNAGRTHAADTGDYRRHWNTPTTAVLDTLGRPVQSILRNGPNPAVDWFTTRSAYDIRGNLLTVTDALGRLSSSTVYDLVNNPLRGESLDGGVQRTVRDAAGNVVEGRDSKGALVLSAFDSIHRLIRVWARDGVGEPVTLRQYIIYADSGEANLTPARLAAGYLLGKPHRHYDEAGLLTFEAYDFKGNLLSKTRGVISDAAMLQAQPFFVDWQPPAGQTLADRENALLDPADYSTGATYDALNRAQAIHYPRNVVLRPQYNRAGALQSVQMDNVIYVRHIAYNAKGQRTLIAYGNDVMTRYAFDQRTFRLARMRTERYTSPAGAPFTFQPAAVGQPLQDCTYEYDLAANLRRIDDRTPGGGVINNPQAGQTADPNLARLLAAGDALVRQFEYDPLYRLISATGRECDNIPIPRPWDDAQRCGFGSGNHGTPSQDNAPNMTALYRETYAYDPAGNLVELRHQNGAAWTRHFGFGGNSPDQWRREWPNHVAAPWPNPPSNRLTHVGDDNPAAPQTHVYDAGGNLVREMDSRHFEWDHSDNLRTFRNQLGHALPTVQARYLYDAAGQRVKKLVLSGGNLQESSVYVDGIFEHHRRVQGAVAQENFAFHVTDDRQRIATVRQDAAFPGDNSPAVQYHFGDHLGSSNLVVDDQGAWINREEYTPYGETSFGSFAAKRYRFGGKERDQESGVNYHGARYYAAWLGRWLSCDPIGLAGGSNLYAAFGGNPINSRDPTGTQPEASADMVSKESDSRGAAQKGQFAVEERELKDESTATVRAYTPSGRAVFEHNLRVFPSKSTRGMVVLGPLPSASKSALDQLRPEVFEAPTGTRGQEQGSIQDIDLKLMTPRKPGSHGKKRPPAGSPGSGGDGSGGGGGGGSGGVPSSGEGGDGSGGGSGGGGGGGGGGEKKVERTLVRVYYRIVPWKERENLSEEGPQWRLGVTVTGLVDAEVKTSTAPGYIKSTDDDLIDRLINPEVVQVKHIATLYNVNPGRLGTLNAMGIPSVEVARQRIKKPITVRLSD